MGIAFISGEKKTFHEGLGLAEPSAEQSHSGVLSAPIKRHLPAACLREGPPTPAQTWMSDWRNHVTQLPPVHIHQPALTQLTSATLHT